MYPPCSFLPENQMRCAEHGTMQTAVTGAHLNPSINNYLQQLVEEFIFGVGGQLNHSRILQEVKLKQVRVADEI